MNMNDVSDVTELIDHLTFGPISVTSFEKYISILP